MYIATIAYSDDTISTHNIHTERFLDAYQKAHQICNANINLAHLEIKQILLVKKEKLQV